MQNADVLIKVVIPVVLLIFWGLSSVFNREKNEKASKERASGFAPRPTLYQTPKTAAPTSRPSSPKDEVMVIRAEPGRTPSRQPQKRNAGRGRGNAGPPGRRPPESTPDRSREMLGSNVSADVNQSLNRPLELRSLTETMALSPSASATASISSQSSPTTAATIDLRAALMNPIRIREAFVLNEILQPPVSRRGRRR